VSESGKRKSSGEFCFQLIVFSMSFALTDRVWQAELGKKNVEESAHLFILDCPIDNDGAQIETGITSKHFGVRLPLSCAKTLNG
jgi:hypothetical protein